MYTTTAPRPRWDIPSHTNRYGMNEEDALKASLMYRSKAELLIYDLLNVGDNRTNQALLEDLDILYRLRGDLWKDEQPTTQTSSSNLKQSLNQLTFDEDNMPHYKSQEFTELAKLLSQIPRKHRKELATHIGFGERRKSKHRPSNIYIPETIPERSHEQSYDPKHFTTMFSEEIPIRKMKR